MDSLNSDQFSSKVEEFMSTVRTYLDKLFIEKDHSINAKLVLNELKRRNIDIEKLNEFMKTLPEEQWNLKIFFKNIDKLNELFGISDELIRKCSVEELTNKNIQEIRWKVLVDSMLEYSKFAKEFYDALKYNETSDMSISEIKLLNEIMLVFKYIQEQSKELYNKYKDIKLSSFTILKFNETRIPIEYFLLRIIYIFMHLDKAKDKKFEYFAKLLGSERISVLYQLGFKPNYNV
ncbi:hypothetical protein J4448_05030 [Candidatus Woesearchaeota archaeon]|nr:hypothetical protein [Candidatus Woesearchaeota archaeon]